MITSIQMKNCATYGDEVESLSSLQKVNFIYGANGSGKSTISSYLQNPLEERFSQCNIIRNEESSVVAVYNKKFKEDHFQDNIDGVFTLGKATKEQLEEIEELKKQRDLLEKYVNELKSSLTKKKEELGNVEEQFVDSVWKAILKKHEKEFSEAFAGLKSSKKNFFNEFTRRYGIKSTVISTYEMLVNKAEVLFSKKPLLCECFSLNVDDIINEIEKIICNTVWKTVIIGNKDVPIANLIEELNNHDWVHEGMSYIGDTGICPFCQKKTIDNDFVRSLDQYFDDEYKKNVEKITTLSENYETQVSLLIKNLSALLKDEERIRVGEVDINKYNLVLNKLERILENNREKFSAKNKEPARVFELESIIPVYKSICKLIDNANKCIYRHNELVRNYKDERKALIDDIWNYCLLEQKELIDSFYAKQTAISKGIKGIESRIRKSLGDYQSKNNEIIEKETNVTSVQETVTAINRSLKAFGFHGFKIVPSKEKENAYQILREDGTIANHTLSEGEETFITFLYFLQYVKGSTDIKHVSSKKIVVLDDPICSLDSNVLYVVSAMVKELANEVKNGTSDAEQLIVLTHNVFFHKEASFINGRTVVDKDVNYWIISKDNNISSIRAYGQNNPISTSYELLWRELRDNSEASKVTIQNTMRRILENYFRIFGSKKNDVIINGFKTLEEQIICRSLLYWVNDGSHSITDDLYIDSYSDSADKYKSVFRQIFVNTKNLAHYNMMMGITDESEDVE